LSFWRKNQALCAKKKKKVAVTDFKWSVTSSQATNSFSSKWHFALEV
jgi:hypothetical protein